jgi:hypothetical protein
MILEIKLRPNLAAARVRKSIDFIVNDLSEVGTVTDLIFNQSSVVFGSKRIILLDSRVA